jgi:hypothetical protein
MPLAVVILAVVLTACAGVKVSPQRLQVDITPQEVNPGTVVTVRVRAPEGTTKVTGRLDLPGSPVVPLKSRDNGQTWVFVTQIPIDAVWTPGKYRVIIRGIDSQGSELQGESWIDAQ